MFYVSIKYIIKGFIIVPSKIINLVEEGNTWLLRDDYGNYLCKGNSKYYLANSKIMAYRFRSLSSALIGKIDYLMEIEKYDL